MRLLIAPFLGDVLARVGSAAPLPPSAGKEFLVTDCRTSRQSVVAGESLPPPRIRNPKRIELCILSDASSHYKIKHDDSQAP